MTYRTRLTRMALLLLCGTGVVSVMGAQCTVSGLPVPEPIFVVGTVDVELINNSPEYVAPGLFVDGVAYVVDPPLSPGESIVVTVDCFAGTPIEIDAAQVFADGTVLSDNVPLLVEGIDYLCGDTVSFFFVEDAQGFFTQVAVNGALFSP